MKTLVIFAVALCCWSGATTCMAAPQAHDGQVKVSGDPRGIPLVSASGHAVSLRQALDQIVPQDYSINLPNSGSWSDVPVSWHAKQTFVAALREALADSPGLNAEVDTRLHLVTVRAQPSAFGTPAPQVLPIAAARQPADGPSTSNLSSVPTATAPVVSPAAASLLASSPAPVLTPSSLTLTPPPLVSAVPAAAKSSHAASSVNPIVAAAAAIPASPASAGSASSTGTLAAQPGSRAVALVTVPDTAGVQHEPSQIWRLELSDGTVKAALTRWARQSGWQIVWDVPVDFKIDAEAEVSGTLQDALAAVVKALQNSDTPIQVVLYNGNKVLRVVAKGAA